MKKVILLSLFTLGAVILAPVVASAAWTAPLTAPPTCTAGSPGCDAPINVGPVIQEKAAGISLSVPTGYGALWIKNRPAGTVGQQVFGINPQGALGQGYWTIFGSADGSTWRSLITGRNGKIGVGTQTNPQEALDVAGAVKIGTTATANAGTIRWTGQDFEGYMGTKWTSLTAGGGSGGVKIPQSCPSGQYVTGVKSDGSFMCEGATYCKEGDSLFRGADGLYRCGTVTYVLATQQVGGDQCYIKSDTNPEWNTIVGGRGLTTLSGGNWRQCISVLAALPGIGIGHDPLSGATSFTSPAQVPLTDLNTQMLPTSPFKKMLNAVALTRNKSRCRIADRTGDGVVTYDDFITLDASVGQHSIGRSLFALDCQ